MTGRAPSAADPPDTVRATRALVLRWLGARDLSTHEIRLRLRRRGCPDDVAAEAVAELRQSGAIDDERVARSRARVESSLRGRGRGRVLLQLRTLGIDDKTASHAVDAVFADLDEAALLERAIARRLKTASASIRTPAEYRRIFAALVRQGFPPADVRQALDARRSKSWDAPDDTQD